MSTAPPTMPGDFNLDLSGFDLSDFIQTSVDPSGGMYQQHPPQQQHGSGRTSNGNPANANPQDHLKQFASSHQHHVEVGGAPSAMDGSFQASLAAAAAEHPHQHPHPHSHTHAIPPTAVPNQAVMQGFQRGPIPPVTAETLKLQLQQQIRLQQLQQLQNQILQQQIELISNQGPQRDVLSGLHGLLTPGPSSELRPTTQPGYLSPMTLQAQAQQFQSDPNMLSTLVSPAMTPQTQGSSTMSSTGQPAYQNHLGQVIFSPLTSPALGPSIGAGPSTGHRGFPSQDWTTAPNLPMPRDDSPQRSDLAESANMLRNKRPIEDSASANGPRKRLSPIVKATPGAPSSSTLGGPRKPRATARGRSDLQKSSLDASSPIEADPSMPPPAPPAGPEPQPASYMTDPNVTSSNMEPLTPADLMNLDHRARMPSGLVDTTNQAHIMLPAGPMTAQQHQLAEVLTTIETPHMEQHQHQHQQQHPPAPQQQQPIKHTNVDEGVRRGGKGATATAKGKVVGGGNSGNSRSAKPSPVIRPSNAGSSTPKTILPSGVSADAATQLSQKSNYMLENGRTRSARNAASASIAESSSSAAAANAKKPVNSTHRDAEQRRRDSLKAGFDELRLLLPPIIIDPDSDEPLLPGSAPPRGPQRNNLPPGAEDHPNRGVSKLALLRCSNEYIGRLNRRIERRDNEIGAMRDEIRWLRERLGAIDLGEREEWVDLDKDIDAVEREDPNLGVMASRAIAALDSPIVDGTGGSAAGGGPKRKAGKGGARAKLKEKDGGGMETVEEDDDE